MRRGPGRERGKQAREFGVVFGGRGARTWASSRPNAPRMAPRHDRGGARPYWRAGRPAEVAKGRKPCGSTEAARRSTTASARARRRCGVDHGAPQGAEQSASRKFRHRGLLWLRAGSQKHSCRPHPLMTSNLVGGAGSAMFAGLELQAETGSVRFAPHDCASRTFRRQSIIIKGAITCTPPFIRATWTVGIPDGYNENTDTLRQTWDVPTPPPQRGSTG